jgi:hypothetical protein
MKKSKDMFSAFQTVTVVKTMYNNKTLVKIIKKCRGLNNAKKYRKVAVAMAGKIRGAINACLDFLLHFFVKKKVE